MRGDRRTQFGFPKAPEFLLQKMVPRKKDSESNLLRHLDCSVAGQTGGECVRRPQVNRATPTYAWRIRHVSRSTESCIRPIFPNARGRHSSWPRRSPTIMGRNLFFCTLPRPQRPSAAPIMAPSNADLDTFQELLDGLTPDEPYVKVERRVMVGNVSREILETAQELKCDMIVMGTHGRGGWSRVLAPSVAEHVARQASCPVLTVKTPHRRIPAGDAQCFAFRRQRGDRKRVRRIPAGPKLDGDCWCPIDCFTPALSARSRGGILASKAAWLRPRPPCGHGAGRNGETGRRDMRYCRGGRGAPIFAPLRYRHAAVANAGQEINLVVHVAARACSFGNFFVGQTYPLPTMTTVPPFAVERSTEFLALQAARRPAQAFPKDCRVA